MRVLPRLEAGLVLLVLVLGACAAPGAGRPDPTVVASGLGPPSTRQYVDVALSELGPQYDGRQVCLYGAYYGGFEQSEVRDPACFAGTYSPDEREDCTTKAEVWIDRNWGLGETFLEPGGRVFSDTIACGLLQYAAEDQTGSRHGFGHLGAYSYRLIADIMASAPGESPFRGTLAYGGDCSWVSGDTRRSICYWGFAVAAGDAGSCPSIQDLDIRDSCYYEVARGTHNPGGCAPIRPEATRMLGGGEYASLTDICIYEAITRDHAPCDRIVNAALRNGCYYRVAYETGDPALCARMQRGAGLSRPGDCYGDLAYKLDDLSLCEPLDEQDRDICYCDYAQITRQYEYCDRIVNPAIRENCPQGAKDLQK